MDRDAVRKGTVIAVLVITVACCSGCLAVWETVCPLMSGEDRDDCYFNIGEDYQKPEHCAKIVNAEKSFTCYYMGATLLEDGAYCEHMKNAPWYGTGGTPPVEECYDAFAVNMHSPDACKMIGAGFSAPRTVTASPFHETLSQAECIKEEARYCGKPGNRACRAMNTLTKPVPKGDPKAYYCDSGATFPTWELCPE